jgi:integral membrane protein (TIGR01906 family)
MTEPVERLARVLVALALPIALILAPMHLFITSSYILYEYRQPAFPPSQRFGAEERLRISLAIMRYVRGQMSRQALESALTDRGDTALTLREVDHLEDVRVVMDGLFLAQGIATAFVLVSAASLLVARRWRSLARGVRTGAFIGAGVIGLIVGFSFIDFDTFFTAFHQVFFTEGTWLFRWEDTLIQLYPLPFWINATWKIGAMVVAELALAYLAATSLERRARATEGAEWST